MPKKILLGFAVLGGVCLLFPLSPELLSTASSNDSVIADHFQRRNTSSAPALKTDQSPRKKSESSSNVIDRKNERGLLTVLSGTPVALYSESEAYCRVKKSGLLIPFGPSVKLLTSATYGSEGQEGSRTVTVKSSECPYGTYSEVEFNLSHEVIRVSDCRDMTLEELVVRDGLRTTFNNPEVSPPGGLNLSSAMGLFVVQCPSGLQYSRDGRFRFMNGQVQNSQECLLLDRNNQPLVMDGGSTPAENGCFENGQCIALVQPGAADFEVVDDKLLIALGNPRDILVEEEDSLVIEGQVSVHDELLGLTGKNWKDVEDFVPPEDCPE